MCAVPNLVHTTYGILFQRRNLADQPRSSLLLAQQSLLQKRGPFGTWEFDYQLLQTDLFGVSK